GVLLAVLPVIALRRVPHPTQLDKTCRLQYKAKQGQLIHWTSMCCGGTHIQFQRVQPPHHDVNLLKLAKSLQSVAQEVLNSDWVGEDSTYTFLRLSSSVHSIELSEEILTLGGSLNQPISTGDAGADICRPQELWSLKRPQVLPHYWWFSPCTKGKAQYSPAPPLLLICH
ncbi:60S ribosomal protein L15, partial [Galemys pyrenaicus]